MAKKTTSKILKDGKLHFYTGGKKATEKEIKSFISNNYQITPPEKLTPEYKSYLNKVKAGKARYANSLTDKSGRYLSHDAQKRALKLINIEQIKKDKQLDTIRDVFKDSPALEEQFNRIINQTGVYVWYNSHNMMDKVKSFKGKIININEHTTKQMNAARRLREFISTTKRNYEAVDQLVKFSYFGVDRLDFTLPTESDYEALETVEDFNEHFDGEIILIVSKQKDKKKKEKKAGTAKAKKSGSGNISYAEFQKNKKAAMKKKYSPKNHKPSKKKK